MIRKRPFKKTKVDAANPKCSGFISEPQTIGKKLLRYIGQDAKKYLSRWPERPHPVLRELAKLDSDDPSKEGYDLWRGRFEERGRRKQVKPSSGITWKVC